MSPKKQVRVPFINEKGGVGVSTSVVNTAYFISKLGYKVLIIDLDPQASTTSMMGLGNGHVDNPDTFTSYDLFFNMYDPKKDISTKNGVDIITADDRLAVMAMGRLPKGSRQERILEAFFEVHKLDYDFVLIDCKGTISMLSVNALVVSTDIVVVMQAQYLSVEGFPKLLKTLNTLKADLGISPNIVGILMTMFNKGHTQDVKQLEKIMNSPFKALLFNSIIRTNKTLCAASERALPVGLHDARSRGSFDYLYFAKELVEKTIGIGQ